MGEGGVKNLEKLPMWSLNQMNNFQVLFQKVSVFEYLT